MKYIRVFVGFSWVCLNSSIAQGIDQPSVMTKYSLVGVIANGTEAKKHKGIAVIRDIETKRSLTISVGDFLPYSPWKVQTVERDRIIVANGTDVQEVRYLQDQESEVQPKAASSETTPVEQGFSYAEGDVSERHTMAQKTWEDFYKDRRDSEEFDRRVTIVVGDRASESPENAAKESNVGVPEYTQLIPTVDAGLSERLAPEFQPDERVNLPDEPGYDDAESTPSGENMPLYEPLVH